MIIMKNDNNKKQDLVKLSISIFPSCPLLRALANTLPSRQYKYFYFYYFDYFYKYYKYY